jgi:hypothetical protein
MAERANPNAVPTSRTAARTDAWSEVSERLREATTATPFG